MAGKQKEESSAESPAEDLELLTQSEEARREALERSAGGLTATGVERERMLREDEGEEPDSEERRPEGEERGSTVPIAFGAPEPDLQGAKNPPIGLQAEPAIMLTNGTQPPGFVATPGGPMPVSGMASSPEEAAALLRRQKEANENPAPRSGDFGELTEEQLKRMSAAEIRAVAIDRGYPVMPGGRRATAAAFLKHQGEDERVTSDESSED